MRLPLRLTGGPGGIAASDGVARSGSDGMNARRNLNFIASKL
jgi:hypothetical protein